MVAEVANTKKDELDSIYHECSFSSSRNQVRNREQNKWLQRKNQARMGYAVVKKGDHAFKRLCYMQ